VPAGLGLVSVESRIDPVTLVVAISVLDWKHAYLVLCLLEPLHPSVCSLSRSPDCATGHPTPPFDTDLRSILRLTFLLFEPTVPRVPQVSRSQPPFHPSPHHHLGPPDSPLPSRIRSACGGRGSWWRSLLTPGYFTVTHCLCSLLCCVCATCFRPQLPVGASLPLTADNPPYHHRTQ